MRVVERAHASVPLWFVKATKTKLRLFQEKTQEVMLMQEWMCRCSHTDMCVLLKGRCASELFKSVVSNMISTVSVNVSLQADLRSCSQGLNCSFAEILHTWCSEGCHEKLRALPVAKNPMGIPSCTLPPLREHFSQRTVRIFLRRTLGTCST